ncbi:MAG: FAD-dependent oxidoreductase [Vicinamibacterales bacterium]|jgi:spermidine dehydrogenase|nr:FAD-dependent oxidoreductase [Vicinamibacterales bacterium]MDP7480736.1 FAD-dependent oxidoreductase [Vicinamibacterales bacterium]MDP7690740.1 FAD-dependent oxidoreductase [Vicinamibacterales bacterium]HJN43466.1 FAD-dependent oxidoreductase [Vicinamibacterales bacterium]|tara:strand:- start:1898 stop:3853 length:1956 start_codon:yes stop_codon:yes gene_type:complete
MANAFDRDLGMHRGITRRDFLNGVALPVGGALVLPRWAGALEQAATVDDYPPTLTGMRGSHDGSWEVAHQMRDQRGWDISRAADTGERYDLVIVGGGISGLAAAHFFITHVGRDARVLVLDNHDDFGGHAKRNEFRYNGRTLALNGGTLNIESPERYNAPSRALLDAIGIDLDRFLAANADSRRMYRRLGLGSAYFFDKETWGADRLVKRDGGRGYSAEFLAQTPLSDGARRDLLRLYGAPLPDYLPGLSSAEKKARLAKMTYTDFMLNLVKVDPQVMWFFQNTGHGSFSVGADALPALFAWEMGQPGFSGLQLEPTPAGVLADLPGGHHGRQRPGRGAVHFPDGNATITRLLMRWLIPDAVPGSTQEDVGTARVDYGRLDRPNQAARIRLNSTVVHVRHRGSGSGRDVEVSYVRGGQTHQVRGRACVMACWNTVIPYLVPELPQRQREALAFGVKAPLVYTSIAIRNWTAFENLGVSRVSTPSMYHTRVGLDEAVSLGDLHHAESPDEPVVLSLAHYPGSAGKPRKEQHRIGRQDLLSTTFETFERKLRDQLGRVLGGGGFDPGRDILAITVNRWPHGYAYTYNSLYDPMEWVYTSTNERPCVIGRQPFGQITIANSDAAASPHTDAAMLEAHRAVQEVLQRRAMPVLGG